MTALLVGVGNRTRGDDAVGPEVAARVESLGLPGLRVVVCDEPLALLEHLAGHDPVVVVDATAPAGSPGRLRVVPLGAAPLGRDRPGLGTHGLGVAEAVELARATGRLPARVTVVGVEAETFALGDPLSPRVRDALDGAVRAVVGSLAQPGPSRARPGAAGD